MIASVTIEIVYFSSICVQLREDRNVDDLPFHVEKNSSAENITIGVRHLLKQQSTNFQTDIEITIKNILA